MHHHSSSLGPNPIRKPNRLQKLPPRPVLLPAPSPQALSISPLQLALLHPPTEPSAITVTTISTPLTTSFSIHKPFGTRWYSVSGLLETERCNCGSQYGDNGAVIGNGPGQIGRGVGGRYVVTFFVRRLGVDKASGLEDSQTKGYGLKKEKDWWEESSSSSSQGRLFSNSRDGEGDKQMPDDLVFAFEYEDLDIAREVQRRELQRENNGLTRARDVRDWRRETTSDSENLAFDMGWSGHEANEEGRNEEEYKLEVSISVPAGHDAVFEKIDSEDGSQIEFRFERDA